MMRLFKGRPRFWSVTCLAVISASASAAGGGSSRSEPAAAHFPAKAGDFDVLTYNVKALPWPIAGDRTIALRQIGDRLAQMRRAGRQPDVVVLQEAFLDQAKDIGRVGGYRYRVRGNRAGDAAPDAMERVARHWYIGETQRKRLDSGLVLLSDHPIVRSSRIAFASEDCAGFDCLAAKGALLAEVALPSGQRIAIATTHLNSRSASAATPAEADAAFARQARSLGIFLRREWRGITPLVFAGDFNRGNRRSRTGPLLDALTRANAGEPAISQLDACLASPACRFVGRSAARRITDTAHDLQYVLQGQHGSLTPIGGSIPFPDPGGLSDHPGFTLQYRLIGPG